MRRIVAFVIVVVLGAVGLAFAGTRVRPSPTGHSGLPIATTTLFPGLGTVEARADEFAKGDGATGPVTIEIVKSTLHTYETRLNTGQTFGPDIPVYVVAILGHFSTCGRCSSPPSFTFPPAKVVVFLWDLAQRDIPGTSYGNDVPDLSKLGTVHRVP